MKPKRKIVIARDDYERLENLFHSEFAQAFSDKHYLHSLRGELDAATIVEMAEVPHDVVTMNSVVRLQETGSNEVGTFTLVYPVDANIAEGKLSILAPIGTAILGYRVGDKVRWQVPDGTAEFVIEELVFQPERDGVVA
ncbi:nucleoside diphosphate kinase regulator [Adhaeretor mobilis]|uniref:Regulator of nucleoside diphosphate kinase n=1 Tax=Adhaeretor mobilis TaxID=1930276 RepID=A0A517MXG3_9BACT|nr:nucleoside diphosphate kinase regulator [Adhaeretor mobilis]QDS99553.1 Regulator of nucleoside diphosphate kinase [Adhaeretor mobilis]